MSPHIFHPRTNIIENGVPKKPLPSQIGFGEIVINYNNNSPRIFIKKENETIAEFIDEAGVQSVVNSKITTELSSGSTNTQVPSAKVVYDTITENEEVTSAVINDLKDNKQDIISDIGTIRLNAAAGKTASDNLGGHTVGVNVPTNAKFTDTTYNTATTSTDGLMSSSDKTKLNGIATGATKVVESTVSGWGFTKNTGTYSKPSTGIPKTDLASAIQTSLGKADTALQSHQTLKTINGQSILGSGNLQVSTTPVTEWGDTPSDTNIPSEKLVYDTISENEEVTSAAINDLNNRLLALEQSLLELTNQILN